MRNKGFTLLELLGVMIILAILVTLVFPSVINFIKSSTSKKDKLVNDLIISAAESYINDNSANLYISNGNNYCVTVDTLVETQYLNYISELDNYPKESKSVKISYQDEFKYEIVDSDSCFICKSVSDSDGSRSLTVGDKYQCKVKDDMEEGFEDGYYFYVLSHNDDATTNLIMERNIYYDESDDKGKVATEENKGIVTWISGLTYGCGDFDSNCSKNDKGPITAMDYLYKATKDWNNIPNISMNYVDEGVGYGSIKTVNELTKITTKDGSVVNVLENQTGYSKLKARLPYHSEVNAVGCEDNDYDNHIDKYMSCPIWMVDYLADDAWQEYQTVYQENTIDEIFGYWTISSAPDYDEYKSNLAWGVDCFGSVWRVEVWETMYGVRPVITVSNGLILE